MRGQPIPMSEIESGAQAASRGLSGSPPQNSSFAIGSRLDNCSPQTAQSPSSEHSERRRAIRHAVDEACVMMLLRQGGALPCALLNLSLDGCMIRTSERFGAGVQVRVEVSFKVNGVAFRFNGVTRWTDGRNLAGIAFVDVLPRRREALAEVLAEVDAALAAKAAKTGQDEAERREADQAALDRAEQEAAEPRTRARAEQEPARQAIQRPEAAKQEVAEQEARQSAEQRAAERVLAEWTAQEHAAREAAQRQAQRLAGQPTVAARPEPAQTSGAQPAEPSAVKPAPRERRAQQRLPVDTSVVIHMVRAGSELPGRILDLSLGGCRIRTAEPFPVGIYTRVESEFHVQGLPFRLAGVIQAIHDRGRLLVGIRFLDMSERKREQLQQLIAELAELAEGTSE